MGQYDTRIASRHEGWGVGIIRVMGVVVSGHGMMNGLRRQHRFGKFARRLPWQQQVKDNRSVLHFLNNSSPSWDRYSRNTRNYLKFHRFQEHNSSIRLYSATCLPCTE